MPSRLKSQKARMNSKSTKKTSQDDLSFLSVITVPPDVRGASEKAVGHRSRFFFFVPEEVIEHQKAVTAPVVPEYDDAEITKLTKRLSSKITTGMDKNADRIVDFFATKLAPLTLALDPASERIQQSLGRILNTEVDESTLRKFRVMLERATNVAMANFIVEYLGLSAEDKDTLLFVGSRERPAKPHSPVETESDSMRRTLAKTLKSVEGMLGGITPTGG